MDINQLLAILSGIVVSLVFSFFAQDKFSTDQKRVIMFVSGAIAAGLIIAGSCLLHLQFLSCDSKSITDFIVLTVMYFGANQLTHQIRSFNADKQSSVDIGPNG